MFNRHKIETRSGLNDQVSASNFFFIYTNYFMLQRRGGTFWKYCIYKVAAIPKLFCVLFTILKFGSIMNCIICESKTAVSNYQLTQNVGKLLLKQRCHEEALSVSRRRRKTRRSLQCFISSTTRGQQWSVVNRSTSEEDENQHKSWDLFFTESVFKPSEPLSQEEKRQGWSSGECNKPPHFYKRASNSCFSNLTVMEEVLIQCRWSNGVLPLLKVCILDTSLSCSSCVCAARWESWYTCWWHRLGSSRRGGAGGVRCRFVSLLHLLHLCLCVHSVSSESKSCSPVKSPRRAVVRWTTVTEVGLMHLKR